MAISEDRIREHAIIIKDTKMIAAAAASARIIIAIINKLKTVIIKSERFPMQIE